MPIDTGHDITVFHTSRLTELISFYYSLLQNRSFSMKLAISSSILYRCVNSYLESSISRAAGTMAKNVFILCRRDIFSNHLRKIRFYRSGKALIIAEVHEKSAWALTLKSVYPRFRQDAPLLISRKDSYLTLRIHHVERKPAERFGPIGCDGWLLY